MAWIFFGWSQWVGVVGVPVGVCVLLDLTCFGLREFIYCGCEMHLVSHIKKATNKQAERRRRRRQQPTDQMGVCDGCVHSAKSSALLSAVTFRNSLL